MQDKRYRMQYVSVNMDATKNSISERTLVKCPSIDAATWKDDARTTGI